MAVETEQELGLNVLKSVVNVTVEVLRVATRTFISMQEPIKKDSDFEYRSDIAGTIHFTANDKSGFFGFCFPEKTFLAVIGRMLGAKVELLSAELDSALGDMVQVISGKVKSSLSGPTQTVKFGIPTVVRGKNLTFSHLHQFSSIIVPFDCEDGPFCLEVNSFIDVGTQFGKVKEITPSLGLFALDTTILVVDDASSMRKVTMKLCKELGFQNFVEASDGSEGWKLIANHHPAIGLVICDLHMSTSTGLDLLTKIRTSQKHENLPFVLLTSETEKTEIIKLLQLGVDVCLLKPLNLLSFEEKIKEIKKKSPQGQVRLDPR